MIGFYRYTFGKVFLFFSACRKRHIKREPISKLPD
nr:MAG TPA: hypothetical protein [Caudoviricetes sp.]